MSKKTQIAVGLDLGAAWVRVAVIAVEEGCIRYAGHAETPSHGWRRGQIADQTAVAESVRQAIREAEASAGESIGAAVVGVGGPAVHSIQSRGVYEFAHRRQIEKDDLKWAVHLASRPSDDDEHLILHVLPQNFTVDGHPPMPHPLNIECLRLEAHALLIVVSAQEHQALVSSVHQASLKIEETVFEPLAAAYASILPDERTAGVALADIGAHSTNVIYYDGDAMVYALGMPVSGDHFTRDMGELKSMSWDEAERMKIAHGCALMGLCSDNIIIELPADGGRPAREVARRDIIEILEARAQQVFALVEDRRVRFARDLPLREGVVLTGGGALLEGVVDVAEKVMQCPARLGLPRGIENWPEKLETPVWSTAAGLAMYSARIQIKQVKSSGPSFWSLITGRT